jgi:hypothetical protein
LKYIVGTMLATAAIALSTPAAASASVSGKWCYSSDKCPVSFSFVSNGEHVTVRDELKDGHSAVLRIWAGGAAKPALWASLGVGTDATRNMTVDDGNYMKFQMCTGEWNDDPAKRKIVDCQDKYFYSAS